MSKMKVRIKTKRFLELIAKNNWTQNGFALLAHLTSGHLSQLVRGKRNVSASTREKILSQLQGTTFDDIFLIKFSAKR
jgi:transcriptional regulator with XRE-family HTH domain